MGDDPATSVVDADCRSWDIRNMWVCDGSVFPTVGGVNPSPTIQAIACRTADRIRTLAARGSCSAPPYPGDIAAGGGCGWNLYARLASVAAAVHRAGGSANFR